MSFEHLQNLVHMGIKLGIDISACAEALPLPNGWRVHLISQFRAWEGFWDAPQILRSNAGSH